MIFSNMTQRKFSFALAIAIMFLLGASVFSQQAWSAEVATTAPKLKKSADLLYTEGMQCLKKSDIPCVQIALATLPSGSRYAKLLAGNLAAQQQDFDTVLNLLIPLQYDKTLTPEASASLHASLAVAYDGTQDSLHALEQWVLVDTILSNANASPADIEANRSQLWAALSQLRHTELVELRGNSQDTDSQGWIDLALAAQQPDQSNLMNWRMAYPDHPGKSKAESLLANLVQTPAASNPSSDNAPAASNEASKSAANTIALLLPFSNNAFYPVADAIQRGFMAAQANAKDNTPVEVYATNGDPAAIGTHYQAAVKDGARYIVGPLTRNEVNALMNSKLDVPTLTLNYPETTNLGIANLYAYGLSADVEASAIVKLARRLGMQTATIVLDDDKLAARVAQAFYDAWTRDGGQVSSQIVVTPSTDMAAFKTQIAGFRSDMIFLATDAEAARTIRPYLDIATPTFAISQIYSGIAQNTDDAPLNAIRFVDMPWLVDPQSAQFQDYADSASDLPPGDMQRWFALGADAYALISKIAKNNNPNDITLQGLSGKLRINGNTIQRELPVARFSPKGIMIEQRP